MKKEMIDYHCHLLPAIDDGATDLQESVAMARILARFGFTTVHCTPHLIRGCYENLPERVTHLTASLQKALDQEGIELRLVPGTEHYLDEFLPELLPGAISCGPSRRLLVEAPFRIGGETVQPIISVVSRHGFRPLIAHPERCAAFEPPPIEEGFLGGLSRFLGSKKDLDPPETLLNRLRQSGCAFQGNLGSFAGSYGREVKQRAIQFLKQGVYSCIGSDAHRSYNLEVTLTAAYQVIAAEIGDERAGDLFAGKLLAD